MKRTCEICDSENAEIVGGDFGTHDFQRFCEDCWKTIEFDWEEQKQIVGE